MFGIFQGTGWKKSFNPFHRQLNLTLNLTFSKMSPKKSLIIRRRSRHVSNRDGMSTMTRKERKLFLKQIARLAQDSFMSQHTRFNPTINYSHFKASSY